MNRAGRLTPMQSTVIRSVSIALVVAAALAGCGSKTQGTTTQPSTPAPITLHDSDNAKSINAVIGQEITVELGGPNVAGAVYWQFAAVPAGVLTQIGDQVVAGASPSAQSSGGIMNPPGMGIGTVSLNVQVESAGTQTITAHRDTCGEAMMCSPDQADFKVTINAA